MTGRGASRQRALTTDGVDRRELQTVGTGSLEAGRQRAGQQTKSRGPRAGRGVLRRQAEKPSNTLPGGPRGENRGMQEAIAWRGQGSAPSGAGAQPAGPGGGVQQNEARSASARSALAAKRRRAVVNPCATRGMVERSGVPLVRRTMDPPSAKRRRTGTVRAFEALRVYNKYNCTVTVQDLNLWLGCAWSAPTGREVIGGRCGPAAAGRAGPFDRKEQSFFPRHFGPSGLRSLREERYSSLKTRKCCKRFVAL